MAKNFRQSPARAGRRPFRQGIGCKKSGLDNLVIGSARAGLQSLFNPVEQDVIARCGLAIEIDAKQHWRLREREIPLLCEFDCQRLLGALARLNPSSGQMPPRHIGMPDKKDASFAVIKHSADAERHAATEPEPEMQNPDQHTVIHALPATTPT